VGKRKRMDRYLFTRITNLIVQVRRWKGKRKRGRGRGRESYLFTSQIWLSTSAFSSGEVGKKKSAEISMVGMLMV
jgi:hypothetical protein